MNKGGYKFKRVRCSVCGKLVAENWIVRHAKKCQVMRHLTTAQQLVDFVSGRK